MFDSDWQEGNIDRAAYITLKVDGFPFDEVYEVMMMYIQKHSICCIQHAGTDASAFLMGWQVVGNGGPY
jgi:hypothetical protein